MNTDTPADSSNSVDVRSENLEPPSWEGSLRDYVNRVLRRLSISGCEVSILLTDDQTMTGLNREFRGRDEPTDVLSFVADEPSPDGNAWNESQLHSVRQTPDEDATPPQRVMGDIVIDVPLVERQAREFAVDFDEELRRVLTHGLLHLAGYEHRSNDFQEEPMLRFQEELLHELKERIL